MTFGTWLEERLTERDIERSVFIRELGYAPSTVSRWLRGAEPSASAIIRIADVLGLDEKEVLYRAAGIAPPSGITPRSDDDIALAEEAARLTREADILTRALANRARARRAAEEQNRVQQ